MVNPSIRLSLSTTCTGQACNTAKYQWQLVTVNSNGNKVSETSLTRDMTETDLDLPGIIIKGNQLTALDSSLFYRLNVRLPQDNGPSGNAAYQFRVNAAPRPGRCTVTPDKGVALKTEFVFICIGWQVRRMIFSLATASTQPDPLFHSVVLRSSRAIFLHHCSCVGKPGLGQV